MRGSDGSHSSWPHDIVRAEALVTFLLGVIGSCEHAPSLHSPLDIVEVGDLPSDAVMLSATSAVICPPPTSQRAPTWISHQRAYTTSSAGCALRPDEISPVPQMTVPTFRSPYAGGFFEAAHPDLHLFHGLREHTDAQLPLAPLAGLTYRRCRIPFMVRTTGLHSLRRSRLRFTTTSHPEAVAARYVALW